MKKVIFSDSTLQPEDLPQELSKNYIFKNAIRRGDLINLVADNNEYKEIIIVDGVFESAPSITHKEILYAVSQGLKVIGISSMGALRASELNGYGMLGYGEIYNDYVNSVIDGDDEVAVAYVRRKSTIYSTIPLINLRKTAEKLNMTASVVDVCRKVFYKNRDWPALKKVLDPTQYELIKRNYFNAKRNDVINYIKRNEIIDSGCVSLYFPTTLYWLIHENACNHVSIKDFIRRKFNANRSCDAKQSIKDCNISKAICAYLGLSINRMSDISSVLNDMSEISLTNKFLISFTKKLAKSSGLNDAEAFEREFYDIGISIDMMPKFISAIYKLYVFSLLSKS